MTTQISGTSGVNLIQDGTIQTADFAAGVGPVLTKYYESPEQTIGSAGARSFPHGLGVVPKLWQAFLVCKVAEAGFSIGDVIIANMGPDAAVSTGVSIFPNATNIDLRYGANGTVFLAANKTSGAAATLTNSSWALIVRAWA